MDSEIHYCQEITEKPLNFFFQTGSTKRGKRVLILGESLAKNGWIDSGKAFYTTTGKMVSTGKRLNDELALLNLKLEDCAFTEIAKCYLGKNRKSLSNCGQLCSQHLLKQVAHFKPRIILSLGVITKDVLKNTFHTELQIGEIAEMIHDQKKYLILPLYHPSPANPFGHDKNLDIINLHKDSIIVQLD